MADKLTQQIGFRTTEKVDKISIFTDYSNMSQIFRKSAFLHDVEDLKKSGSKPLTD